MRRYAVSLCVVGLLMVSACTERLEVRQRQVDLSDRLREFTAFIRWGYFDAAAGMQLSRDEWHPDNRGTEDEVEAQAEPEPEELPGQETSNTESLGGSDLVPIRVTLFEDVGTTFNEEQDEAYVTSMIAYYRTEDQTVRRLRYRHTWWYHPERDRWFLDSELPRFE